MVINFCAQVKNGNHSRDYRDAKEATDTLEPRSEEDPAKVDQEALEQRCVRAASLDQDDDGLPEPQHSAVANLLERHGKQ